MKASASEREYTSGSRLKKSLSKPATSGPPWDGHPDVWLGYIGVTRPSPLLIVLSEVDAPGMAGMRSSSLSNRTAESRGLYFFGKKVIGFRGREGVLSITVNANDESDGPLKKSSMSVSSSLQFGRGLKGGDLDGVASQVARMSSPE